MPLTRLLTALLLLLAALPAWGGEAVVFMYHRFGDARFPSTNIRLEQFEAQLEVLAKGGFQVWPLTQVVAHLEQGLTIPDRTVAITVDDAYRTVYTQAYPRLKARGWPFTVFVGCQAVDDGAPDYMDWETMREMQRHGVLFANHGRSHDYMVRRLKGEDEGQWQARMRREVDDCQRRLEQELGRGRGDYPKLFAYPYGEYNPALQALLKELGYTAFGQHSGPVSRYAERQALPRYPIAEAFADPEEFRTKALSRALPVLEARPHNPHIGRRNPPRLELSLGPSEADLERLACYASGQGPLAIEWLDRSVRRFAVQAPEPYALGRARYNCTAPDQHDGRYYWYSHLWIIDLPPAPSARPPVP